MINSIFLTDTIPAAIAKLISSLYTKKSSGTKSVTTFILKSNIYLFCQIVSYSKSTFHEDLFPRSIKIAKVII